MMLKFVTSEVDSFGQKRKQSPRACDQCRKKKKRCDHLADSRPAQLPTNHINASKASSRSNQSALPGNDARDNIDQHRSPGHIDGFSGEKRADIGVESFAGCSVIDQRNLNTRQASATASNTSELGAPSVNKSVQSRFIGDLNPEG